MKLLSRVRRSSLVLLGSLSFGGLLSLFLSPVAGRSPEEGGWKSLEPGLELGVFPAPRPPTDGDGRIWILRIDPDHFDLRLLNASATDEPPHSVRDWARRNDLVAAINASMYQKDHRTSTSLMQTRHHTNHARLSRDKAVLAFDRRDDDRELPVVQIIDRTCQDFDSLREHYGSLVQSIRMVSCDGENVWSPQAQSWSTAAVGIDEQGHVLFVHAPSRFTTHDLIDILLDLPIDLHNAMYLEGGTQAQMYVHSGDFELELTGRHESGLQLGALPIPNAIGLVRRAEPTP